jgi:multiple sugar transport system permease protein
LKKQSNKVVFYLTVIFLVVLSYFPLYWLFLTSVKPKVELFQIPPTLITLKPVIDHYVTVFKEQPFGLYYWNSTLVAVYTMVFTLVLGTMMAYAVARLNFKGKPAVLLLVMATAMLPTMSMVLPIFMGLREVKLLNTHLGLALTQTAFFLPMVVWLLAALFREIPKELEEATWIDGYNRFQSFIRVLLPLSAPAMVTACILIFVQSWNEFLLSFTLLSEASKRTLPVGIMMFPGEYDFPWSTISAAIILSIVPLVLVILFFQKKIVQGLTNGAVKG